MKTRLIAILFASSLLFTGCNVAEQFEEDLVDPAAVESWCTTANSQVVALQSIIRALEDGVFVTGVIPLAEGTGYTITLFKSNPIVIKYVDDASDEQGNITPIIGVARDTDGIFYWTIKIGDADVTWLLDNYEKKIPVIGTASQTASIPSFMIKSYTNGHYYWQINGRWLNLNNSLIPATPSQADIVFADNGVDNTNADYVEFTLATGEKIQLLKSNTFLGADNTNDAITITTEELTIPLCLKSDFKESDYSSIQAKMISGSIIDTDIATKADAVWEVQVNKPTFENGVCQHDASITIRPIMGKLSVDDVSLLEVSIIDANDDRTTVSREIKAGKIAKVDKTTHSLTLITKGSLEADLITQAIDGSNTLIINGLLSGGFVTNTSLDGDWNILRATLDELQTPVDLTMNNITEVPNLGFWMLAITSISFPEVTSIGEGAFSGCTSLAEISIPKVTSIEKFAFQTCSILKEISLPEVIYIRYGAFNSCSKLEEITLPKATLVGDWAFIDCIELKEISLPEASSIGEEAFFHCAKLTEVSLPKATSIKGKAFKACSSITEVSLPEATSIGNEAFSECRSLTEILLLKATSIGDLAFSGCGSLTEVSLPEATLIGTSAFYNCDILADVSLPEATYIGYCAFDSCQSLVEISLPEASYIGYCAFHNCQSLAEISMPNADQIRERAFYHCLSLTEVSLPMATYIGEEAFIDCQALAEISLPKATAILQSAFGYCTSLADVSLPRVVNIGDFAFRGCTALKKIRLALTESILQFGSDVFEDANTSLCNLYIGESEQISSLVSFGDNISWRGYTWKSIAEYE